MLAQLLHAFFIPHGVEEWKYRGRQAGRQDGRLAGWLASLLGARWLSDRHRDMNIILAINTHMAITNNRCAQTTTLPKPSPNKARLTYHSHTGWLETRHAQWCSSKFGWTTNSSSMRIQCWDLVTVREISYEAFITNWQTLCIRTHVSIRAGW